MQNKNNNYNNNKIWWILLTSLYLRALFGFCNSSDQILLCLYVYVCDGFIGTMSKMLFLLNSLCVGVEREKTNNSTKLTVVCLVTSSWKSSLFLIWNGNQFLFLDISQTAKWNWKWTTHTHTHNSREFHLISCLLEENISNTIYILMQRQTNICFFSTTPYSSLYTTNSSSFYFVGFSLFFFPSFDLLLWNCWVNKKNKFCWLRWCCCYWHPI